MPSSLRSFCLILTLACMCITFLPNAAEAAKSKRKSPAPNLKYADIVIDYDTGAILHQDQPDKRVHPASTTKIMTLMLLFEALDSGRVSLNDNIRFSSHAASAEPSKLGIPPGGTIKVKDAILALCTKSANDVAVAVAEHLGGTESNFARLMTERAHQIGMSKTTFKNAHGLHNPSQVTTVRDMATLATFMIARHPRHYHYFSTRSFTYKGATFRNHNRLLGVYPGMDGLKTGFINASGFNLVASAKRNGRRVIAVVFGGRSAQSRNARMTELLDQAFKSNSNAMMAKNGRQSPNLAMAAVVNAPTPLKKPPVPANLRPQLANYNPSQDGAALEEILAQGDIDPAGEARMEKEYLAQRTREVASTMKPAVPVVSTTQARPAAPTPAKFAQPTVKSLGTLQPIQSLDHASSDQVASLNPKAANVGQAGQWSIQIGAFQSQIATEAALQTANRLLPETLRYGNAQIVPLQTANAKPVYRARLIGFNESDAQAACSHFRDCLTIPPAQ
ncbi:MAG: serine hydrolase [Pseudobdellovibrionaceae bacterium]